MPRIGDATAACVGSEGRACGGEGSGGTGVQCAGALMLLGEICYPNALGLTGVPLAHGTGAESLLGVSRLLWDRSKL